MLGPFDLRKEGDELALYTFGEYQFRMKVEQAAQLKELLEQALGGSKQ